MIDNADCFV